MNGIVLWVPWLLGGLGAVGFGYVGWRSGGSRPAWAVAGGLASFLAATIVLGLADATTLPYSPQHYRSVQSICAAVSAGLLLVALVLAWFLSPYRAKPTA